MRGARSRRRAFGLGVCLALVALLAGVGWLAIGAVDAVPPRSVASRLDAIDGAKHPSVVGLSGWLATSLRVADRGPVPIGPPLPPLTVGAEVASGGQSAAPDAGRSVPVASVDAARRAFETALPGDVIVFAPGTYRVLGTGLAAARPGTAAAPIVVRAERVDEVTIEFGVVEGVNVSAPHWHFENLLLRGICTDDGHCEHAFHVVAGASHFVARNNTVVDFNAHFKVNGQDGRYPDGGLLEHNTLTATRPRNTDNPVTDIDLVGASGWTIRANRITDFVKAGGNRISYGAFVKGGGTGNRFERNVVVCEDRLRTCERISHARSSRQNAPALRCKCSS